VRAHLDRLIAFGRRTRQIVLLSALTGVLTGGAVSLFEWVTRDQLLLKIRNLPIGFEIAAPLVGLLLAAAILRWVGKGVSPSTADEYVKNFHDRGQRLDLRPVPARVLGSVATLGLGGAMGYEGPSIYIGASIGTWLQTRLSRFFSRADAKVLLVCGAAAGVAAIFKAPATGLVFALEVPYQEDLARRMLVPAGIAAAASYVTFAAFAGTEPLFATNGSPPFDFRDLAGAALLGVLCGLGARLFTTAIAWTKRIAVGVSPWARAGAGGGGLVLLGLLAHATYDSPLTSGPGYAAIEWAFDPKRAIGLVVLLLFLRAVATILTVGGGGVGGLFIPLVIEGALLGRAVGGLFRTAAAGSNFFPLIGVSAFLGAGYRVPLAGVMFAAESTGRPGFIVPGVIASMIAQLFMGRASASPYQVARRAGHLERRFELPLTSALRTDVATVPPDTTLEEFVWQHLLGNREKEVPVVDGTWYFGVMCIEEAMAVPRDEWPTERVRDHLRSDFPFSSPAARLRDALAAMEAADVDLLPVIDGDSFVGVVTTDEVLRLDEILDRGEESE
jgi:chloride channel protein, CIC family